IAFEYIDEQDAEVRANHRLRKVLREEAPAIRDAVVNGFAFAPDSLTNVASPKTLDKIVENCLAIQLGDQALAKEVYADVREQVLRSAERWFDVHVSVTLGPWKKALPIDALGVSYCLGLSVYRELDQLEGVG